MDLEVLKTSLAALFWTCYWKLEYLDSPSKAICSNLILKKQTHCIMSTVDTQMSMCVETGSTLCQCVCRQGLLS